MERKDNDLLDKYSDLQKTDSQQSKKMVKTFDFDSNISADCQILASVF